MNKFRKVISVLLILIIATAFIGVMSNKVLAAGVFDLNAFDNDNVAGTEKTIKLVNNTAQTVIGVARIVCVTIAIVILLVIAMKYMMSAPGDRADIKKHAVHYVIGAFVLFAVTGILGVLNDFAGQIK